MSKVWFITGSSKGFGRVWAQAALARGDRVAATARDPSTLDDLVATYGDAIAALKLDVTDKAAVDAAVAETRRRFGRLDVVINDLDGSPQVLRNEIAAIGNWLKVRLKGRGANTGAVGAVVALRVGQTVQRRLVQSGSSYISQEDKRLQFGLGKAGQADSVEVTWPDGSKSAVQNVKANQIIELQQR